MRLLLVEDEHRLAQHLALGLREEGFAVDLAASVAAARERAIENQYDLAILDLGLPDGSGLALLAEWRGEGSAFPVLILTARDLLDDKVAGLNAGADDYLTKPFAFAELLARVRTLLRRAPAPPRQRLVAGDLALDRDARTVEWRGSHLALTGREFALLEYLLLHSNATLSRQQIAEHVWDSDYEARSNTIDVIVARVRRKLERAGAPRLVHAVPGVGYALRPGGGAPR